MRTSSSHKRGLAVKRAVLRRRQQAQRAPGARPVRVRGAKRAALVRAGFTMVEIIVVVILIGIMATLALPRMLGTRDRAADAEAEIVRGLITTLAQRSGPGSQSVALEYDAGAGTLRLMVDHGAEQSAGLTPVSKNTWDTMPLVRPVVLTATALQALVVDGKAQTFAAGTGAGSGGGVVRIEAIRGRARPSLSIVLARESTARAAGASSGPGYQIDLLPGAAAAQLRSLSQAGNWGPTDTRAQDLDAAGQRETPW
ncbi:hypothetical protein BH11PLA1_BH11PLA1_17010 [soil metagenome]